MNALFDSAGLAIVAYAEVAADGTSTAQNSGVTTTRVAAGQYDIILPDDKLQSSPRDILLVQVNGTLSGVPFTSTVDNSDAQNKRVEICNAALATFADSAFTVLVLRTIVPPPSGAPA